MVWDRHNDPLGNNRLNQMGGGMGGGQGYPYPPNPQRPPNPYPPNPYPPQPPNPIDVRMPLSPPIYQQGVVSGGFGYGILKIMGWTILGVFLLALFFYVIAGVVPLAGKVSGGYFGLIDDLFRYGPFSHRGMESLVPFLFASMVVAIIGRILVLKARRKMRVDD